MADADERLKRLYRPVEDGMTELDDVLKDRLAIQKAECDRARATLEIVKSQEAVEIRIDPA